MSEQPVSIETVQPQLAEADKARGPGLANEALAEFINNPGHDELAALYHVELPTDSSERLGALQNLAANYWDFRNGAERQKTEWDDGGALGEEGSDVWNTVFDAATKLSEVESSRPANRKPKYAVFLGGANKAPDDRLRYLLESIDDFEVLVYLGSSRGVDDAEREKAAGYAPDAQTEFDLGCGAFETRLGAKLVSQDKTLRDGDTWAWKEYEFERDGKTKTAIALSTPKEIHGDGGQARRATTYDNWRFFADRAELAKNPDATVVAATTGFYVPGQHLPAVQELTLPYGVSVETIGHDAAYSGVSRKPKQLLQETKSAIDAAVRLETAVAQVESNQ